MNVRSGFRREHDTLPDRLHEDALPSGNAEGRVLPREDFESVLSEYYHLRGWDIDGCPTPEILQELGIDLDMGVNLGA